MLCRASIAATTLAAALFASVATLQAFDDAKYPDLSGQWLAVRLGVRGQPAFDPTKSWGLGQQAPLTPEYQKVLEASLVWGLRSQAPNSRHSPLPSFIPVSLFDLESRFFAPTHKCWAPARAGAVKAGRRSAVALRSIVSRPRLDSPEHGGTLVVVGMTIGGELALGRGSSRHNLVFGRSVRT
jgi:hypothetical protein